MDGETKSGRLTHQLGRPHAWKGGIAGQPYHETVSLTSANMCQGDRGEVSPLAMLIEKMMSVSVRLVSCIVIRLSVLRAPSGVLHGDDVTAFGRVIDDDEHSARTLDPPRANRDPARLENVQRVRRA